MKSLALAFVPCLLSAQAVPGPAAIQSFQATAKAVRKGGAVTLRWSATGTDQVRLEPLGLILPAKGELTHVVTGRMVYWLHVSNAVGGQSVPLVVDLVPEATVPAVPPIPVVPEAPKLASLPPIQPPPLPVALPAPSTRRQARYAGTRRVWIQFAATVSPRGAARLQRTLLRIAGMDAAVLVRNRRSGRPFRLIRTGPFPSRQAARLRLQELASAMQALKMKPILVFGPPQPIALGTTYLADNRQPR